MHIYIYIYQTGTIHARNFAALKQPKLSQTPSGREATTKGILLGLAFLGSKLCVQST